MRHKSCQLRVVSYLSIHEIEESHWDSINHDKQLFHTHRFIRSVEDAKVEDSKFRYLLFYFKEKLVGTAVLSYFTVSLDLLAVGIIKKMILTVRSIFPGFLKIKILFCGLPVSLGQNNLIVADPRFYPDVFTLLAKEMDDICRLEGIRFQCIKEFLEKDCIMMDGLKDQNFFRANSIPYVSMDIRWDKFENYLRSLRHNYRRAIRLSLKKIGQYKPEFVPYNSTSDFSSSPVLVICDSQTCPPQKFFELYLEVMERTKVKLETFNRAFFENIYKNLQNDIEILAMIKEEEILGVIIFTVYENTMTFLWVGLDYSKRDECDVYFNLVYGIISQAIERGCSKLQLGQTSYWFKHRIGGICIPQYFYMKARSWYIHHVMKRFRFLIFPEIRLKEHKVFREDMLRVTESNL